MRYKIPQTILRDLQDRRKDIRLTMLYKIINEITNVLNKEILISA